MGAVSTVRCRGCANTWPGWLPHEGQSHSGHCTDWIQPRTGLGCFGITAEGVEPWSQSWAWAKERRNGEAWPWSELRCGSCLQTNQRLKGWGRSRECTAIQAFENETNLALAHPGKMYHSRGVAKLLLGIMLSAHSLISFFFPTETSQIITALIYLCDHSLNHLKWTFRICFKSSLSAIRTCKAHISKLANNFFKLSIYRFYASLTVPTCMFENW